MDPDQNAPDEVARALIRAFNDKDLASHAALWHEDARYLSPLVGCLEGRDAVVDHVRELFERLPSETMAVLSMSLERRTSQGATVELEVESTGTGPDGEPYVLAFSESLDVRDGRVAEARVEIDPADVATILDHG